MIVRFASALPDGRYHVTFVGQGSDGSHYYYGPNGKLVQPLTNMAGLRCGYQELTAADGSAIGTV